MGQLFTGATENIVTSIITFRWIRVFFWRQSAYRGATVAHIYCDNADGKREVVRHPFAAYAHIARGLTVHLT